MSKEDGRKEEMFAVVKSGGRQCRCAVGDLVQIGRINAEVGSVFDIKNVLLVANGTSVRIGCPFVDGALVKVEVVKQIRSRKIVIFKKRHRHNYQRRHGHRQELTVVYIQEIIT